MSNLISIIICTYTRCESLKDTLKSLAALKTDDSFEWEIVVVDNNSKDATRQVVEDAQASFAGRLRYVFEERQGLSAARNRGVKEAKGGILAFTDDDVTIDPNWLVNIYKGYKTHNPDCLFGKIIPDWQGCEPPQWLTANKRYLGNLAVLNHGEEVFTVTEKNQQFFGANFSVKKEIFQRGYAFDENLGVKGNKRAQGEDTDLFYYLLEQSKKIVYEPSLVVWHKIEKERVQKAYFHKWQYAYGKAEAIMEQNETFVRFLNVPRGQIRSFFEMPLKWFLNVCLFKPMDAVPFEFRWFYTLGYIKACLSNRDKRRA